MNILHIITRMILGGAQENTLLTVEGLHHHYQDEVRLVTGPTTGPEGSLLARADQGGLNVQTMPELVRDLAPRQDLAAYHALRDLIREIKPEVVHTHSSKAGILGRAAAWHERVPVVIHTIHGLPFGPFCSWWRNRLYIALERWAARRCHKIVCVCDAMTTQALAAGVGHSDLFQTVYSGMDVDAFLTPRRSREEVREELGLAPEHVAFGTVARLFELKGHDDIIAVAPKILRERPEVRFVFVGDGILRESLQTEIGRLGLEHAFIFTGLVPADRIPEILLGLDAVIHPSLREGLARVLPQALLVGRPVISYDVDGAREVVLPETGFLLPPRDLDRLGQAIRSLSDDPDLRNRMGQEGRSRFADQFRHETMTRQLRSLYTDLLARR